MSHNACNPTVKPDSRPALELRVNTMGFAPAAAKTKRTPGKNLEMWMEANNIDTAFTYPDRDEVPVDREWYFLAQQSNNPARVSTLVFKPRTCAEQWRQSIRENEAEGRSSSLTVVCNAMSKRGAKNVLEALEEHVEKFLVHLGGERSKLEKVYFIFPEELVGSHVSILNKIGDLFGDTHSRQIYYSRDTHASVAEEDGPAQDSTFVVLVLQLTEGKYC